LAAQDADRRGASEGKGGWRAPPGRGESRRAVSIITQSLPNTGRDLPQQTTDRRLSSQ